MRDKDLTFQYKYPDEELDLYVKYFWALKNECDAKTVSILPDGYFDIMVVFMEGSRKPTLTLIGLATKPAEYLVPARSVTYAVSFKLLAVESVIKQSIRALLNDYKQLPYNLWDIEWENIDSFEMFCRLVVDKMKLICRQNIDPRKRLLFSLIYKSCGDISVGKFEKLTQWRAREINRYFQHNFGLPLKRYLSIVRFRSTFYEVAKGTISGVHQYFDQPHFIREVRKFSGTSPKYLADNTNDRFIQLSTLPLKKFMHK